MEKSKTIRIIDRPIARPTPIHRAINIDFLDTPPVVISSTCFVNTWIAGSARTTTQPNMNPNIIKNSLENAASSWPILYPIGINPTLTDVKNNTKPNNVYKIPTPRLINFDYGKFR